MVGLTSIIFGLKLLHLVRQYFESTEIHNPKVAQLFCHIIPDRCPFEGKSNLVMAALRDCPSVDERFADTSAKQLSPEGADIAPSFGFHHCVS